MIRKHTQLLLGAVMVLAIGVMMGLMGTLQTANAAGSCKDGSNDVNCVSQNCTAVSGFLSVNECEQLVSACENTRMIGSGVNSTLLTNDTAQGNCSNGIRSCFESLVYTQACRNHQVIAAVTQCNNGDVNAGGECGMDAAIDLYNAADGDNTKDYTSNRGARSDFIRGQTDAACKDSVSVAEKRLCEESVRARATSCYDQAGGEKVKVDGMKVQQCLVDGATTPNQCEAAGGKWGEIPGSTGSDAGGCTRIASTVRCKDKSEPDPLTGECRDGSKPGQNNTNTPKPGDSTGTQCGEAETVLIECGEEQGVTAIGNVLKIIVSVLTVLIGIAATGGIAWASVLYAKAEDNSSNVSEAKVLIRNVVIGIILYGFLIAIVNWLVPGGVIG